MTPPVQAAGNFSAVGAAMASFFGMIQGPLAVLASFLSICWLSLQIYSWFERRNKGKR
jgi:hypothetical protein